MSLCPVCNNEMKLIPAGVSKNTGKPYNAFMACPNKCPKIPTNQRYTPSSAPDWDKIRDEKSDDIRQSVALNNACYAFARGKIDYKDIDKFANWIYRWKPAMTNNQGEPVIDLDDIF